MQVHDTTNDRVTAELIFTGGKVHTVNARNDIIEAVAVGDRAIMQTLNAHGPSSARISSSGAMPLH